MKMETKIPISDIPEIPPANDVKTRKKIQFWNIFKKVQRKEDTGSAEKSKYINFGVTVLKIVTLIFTCIVVLGSAIISKGTLLFMTSQLKRNITRPYCNKRIDENKQFIALMPEEERIVWTWLVIFTFMVPELGTFLRSVKILCFKKWKFPTPWEFLWLFITESLPTIGSALLVFVILPELDVIQGAMLTNAVCFIPGLLSFFSRRLHSINSGMKMILDVVAMVAQASAFVVWPLLDRDSTLYFIPVSLLLISCGWWENFLSKKSPILFIKEMAKKKHRADKNEPYYMYSILAPWKCLLFFITTIAIIAVREENLEVLFDLFLKGFRSHNINITQVEPLNNSSDINLKDFVANGYGTILQTSLWTPLSVWLINISATYVCYASGKFACKIMIQTFSFAFPICLSVPVLLTALIAMCGKYNQDECTFNDVIPPYLFFNTPSLAYLQDFIAHQYSWIWLIWLLSQTWITVHIWTNNNEKLDKTETLFFKPMYDAFLIDQSIALNRRRIIKNKKKRTSDGVTRIYACATMWHETKEEMIQFLKSILRMDEDQFAHKIMKTDFNTILKSYYELETHIFFDDAFTISKEIPQTILNEYVQDLIKCVDEAVSEVHKSQVKIEPPDVYRTPYGGRLVWTLPGETTMMVHLKDSNKIRRKKRWSQVMYMYYLLGYRIMERNVKDGELQKDKISKISKNTYLLALDGDVDFQPDAVHALIDLMKKNERLGAACGRLHPVGSGVMAWSQKFEYSIAHWLQKATEHVIGCVLCSPGCFSLFRANALIDDNVMATYTTIAEEPRHAIQYDQGEDRWLCTLLLQRGYRVEYCSASDAYTHCPEGFNEFYKQRTRWMPSTTANILDLLVNYKHIVKDNDYISTPYIIYQGVLLIGTVIGPGTIFLMLLGAFSAAFKMSQWTSFIWNIVPILLFVTVCATCRLNIQLLFAGIISGLYSLVMMAVLIGVMLQILEDGWLAPSSLFFLFIASEFVITALLHPQEFYCLKYGIIYYVTVPSMYMLLVIYCIFNLNVISWGTREDPKTETKDEKEDESKSTKTPKHKIYSIFGNDKDNGGSFEFSCCGMFKVLCCTYQAGGEEHQMLKNMQQSLLQVQQKLDYIERNHCASDCAEPKHTKLKRTTTYIEGSRASTSVIRNYVAENNEQDSDNLSDDWIYDDNLFRRSVYVYQLEKMEVKFWKELIDEYLFVENYKKKDKEKFKNDLKDLRDKVVITFFMINSLFVLVVFLLTLQKDELHINWPINPKINFTYITDHNEIYIEKTYLELEPIGFVFLLCFATLMVLQFLAMLYHRFGTYSHVMANTVLDFNSKKSENRTTALLFGKVPVKAIKELMKCRVIKDTDDGMDAPATRRNTAYTLAAQNRTRRVTSVFNNLSALFEVRMEELGKNKDCHKNLPWPEKNTDAIIQIRRQTIHMNRNSQRATNIPSSDNSGHNEFVREFDNPSYEQETDS